MGRTLDHLKHGLRIRRHSMRELAEKLDVGYQVVFRTLNGITRETPDFEGRVRRVFLSWDQEGAAVNPQMPAERTGEPHETL